METRTDAKRAAIHQVFLGGGTSSKPTCITVCLNGLHSLNDQRCPRQGPNRIHDRTRGRDSRGVHRSERFQHYPSTLCAQIAQLIIDTFVRFVRQGSSPGGPCPLCLPARRRKNFSRFVDANAQAESFAIINELGVSRGMLKLTDHQGAAYVHVDGHFVIKPYSRRRSSSNNWA